MSQGRELTQERELKNEASVHAYSFFSLNSLIVQVDEAYYHADLFF